MSQSYLVGFVCGHPAKPHLVSAPEVNGDTSRHVIDSLAARADRDAVRHTAQHLLVLLGREVSKRNHPFDPLLWPHPIAGGVQMSRPLIMPLGS